MSVVSQLLCVWSVVVTMVSYLFHMTKSPCLVNDNMHHDDDMWNVLDALCNLTYESSYSVLQSFVNTLIPDCLYSVLCILMFHLVNLVALHAICVPKKILYIVGPEICSTCLLHACFSIHLRNQS